jgi:hypothetical protein
MSNKSNLQANNIDLQAILNSINELPEAGSGVALPELTNEGTASDLLSGKQLIDQEGNVVTGTHVCSGGEEATGVCPSLTITRPNSILIHRIIYS